MAASGPRPLPCDGGAGAPGRTPTQARSLGPVVPNEERRSGGGESRCSPGLRDGEISAGLSRPAHCYRGRGPPVLAPATGPGGYQRCSGEVSFTARPHQKWRQIPVVGCQTAATSPGTPAWARVQGRRRGRAGDDVEHRHAASRTGCVTTGEHYLDVVSAAFFLVRGPVISRPAFAQVHKWPPPGLVNPGPGPRRLRQRCLRRT